MRGVYLIKRSPFYWLRYYDKFEIDPKRKRKSHNTKIKVTDADKKRHETRLKLIGTARLREFVDAFTVGRAMRNIELKSGVKMKFNLTLSEGFKEFIQARTVPSSKKEIKQKTVINYRLAVNHLISACGDKKIHKYSSGDYSELLQYLDKVKVKGKTITHPDGTKEKTFKDLSTNSKSIYTRSLSALWNYFKEKNYSQENIIEPVEPEEKDPNPIPLKEMFTIIEHFKQQKEHPERYFLVCFLLLTGCRPSSAMVQLNENIDFKRKILTIQNVKTGKRKNRATFKFPLYPELEKLILNAQAGSRPSGRMFHQFKLNELNYAYPLSFWERNIKALKESGRISAYHTLKQIRSTSASWLINVFRMDVYRVKELLNHADVKITERHYLELDLERTRIDMKDIVIGDLLRNSE